MIAFYGFEFNLLLIEPRVISWNLTKLYNGVGTFSAHLPLDSGAVSLVCERDFTVAKVGDEFVIVTGFELGDELVIYGRTPNWLLTKRVVLPFEKTTVNTGSFVKDRFEAAYQDCPDVVFGQIQEGISHSFVQDSPKILSQTVFDALGSDGLGNELIFDKTKKKWVFDLLKGSDRGIIVSEANKNAASVAVIGNISESANVCYYENSSGGFSSNGNGEGLLRFETFISSGNSSDADAKLVETKPERSVNLETVGLTYKKDYELGDTLRVQIIKGEYRVTKRLKITGVEMSLSPSGYREKPIFDGNISE